MPRRTVTQFAADDAYLSENFRAASKNFFVAQSAPAKTISLHRSGELQGRTTIMYLTDDLSAIHGLDYTEQSGVLTFEPYETMKTFDVGLLNNPLAKGVLAVRLQVRGEAEGWSVLDEGVLWIFSSGGSLITRTFIDPPWDATVIVFWGYSETNGTMTLQRNSTLQESSWQSVRDFELWSTSAPVHLYHSDRGSVDMPGRYYRVLAK
jgi:hypothetical protein